MLPNFINGIHVSGKWVLLIIEYISKATCCWDDSLRHESMQQPLPVCQVQAASLTACMNCGPQFMHELRQCVTPFIKKKSYECHKYESLEKSTYILGYVSKNYEKINSGAKLLKGYRNNLIPYVR